MYSLRKRDPSSNRYSMKQNQHGPATFQLKTQRKQGRQPSPSPSPRSARQPHGPGKCKPAPLCSRGLSRPCRTLAFAQEVPTHAKPSLQRAGPP